MRTTSCRRIIQRHNTHPGGATLGVVHGHGALAKRATVARVPVDEAWLGCPAMSVSSGGVGGSRLSNVGVGCRASRRRRGRFRLKKSRR